MNLLTLSSVEQCDQWRGDWEALWNACPNANPFFHPGFLIPAWRHLGDKNVQLFLFFENNALVGLVPMQTRNRFRAIPAKWQRAYGFLHCFNDEPLGRHGALAQIFFCLQTHWRDTRTAHLFSWLRLPANGPLHQQIGQSHAADELRSVRACLAPKADDYTPLAERLTKKKRKEFARLKRRLEDEGEVTFIETLCEENDPGLNDFLSLEEASWKGEAGSALSSNAADQHFAKDMFANMARAKKLRLYRLMLNGKCIAALTALQSGDHLYLFKISHDERLSRFSPGVLMMIEATELWQTQSWSLIDSCAKQDHPMIDKIWNQRRQFTRAHCSNGSLYGNLLLAFSKIITQRQHN